MESTNEAPTADDLDNLRHMLGADHHIPRKNWGYRNHFAAGPTQMAEMERLVAQGLAEQGGRSTGVVFYHATESGMDAINLPPAAKRRAMEP